MTNSIQKGKRGEREFAHFLEDNFGIEARRGQQYNGLEGEDVVCEFPEIHWEVKRVERFRLYPSLKQAKEDAETDQMPVVSHRRNREDWVVVLDAEDFMDMFIKMKEMEKRLSDDNTE